MPACSAMQRRPMRFGVYCRTHTYCDCLMLQWTFALAPFFIPGTCAEARTNRLAGTRHRLTAGDWSEKPAECYDNGRSIGLGT